MKLLFLLLTLAISAFAQQTGSMDDACPEFTAEVKKHTLGANYVYEIHFIPLNPQDITDVEVHYSMATGDDVKDVVTNEQFQFAHRMSLTTDETNKPLFLATIPSELVQQGGVLVLKFIYSTDVEGTVLHCVSDINLAEIPVPSEDTMPMHAAMPVRGGMGGFGGFRGGMGGMGGWGGMAGGGFGRWRRGSFPWGRGYPGMGMYPPYGFPAGGGFPTGGGFPPGGGGFPPSDGGDGGDGQCGEGEMMAEDGTCVPIPTTGGRTRGGRTAARRESRCPENYSYNAESRVCEQEERIRSPIYFAAPIQLTESRSRGNPYQSTSTSRVQSWYS